MNDRYKIAIFVFALLCNFTFLATAQNPHAPTAEAMKLPECIRMHGEDSMETRRNMAYFQEYFKQGKYTDAYAKWTYVFNHAPCSYKSIHQRGPQILVFLIENENDSVRKARLLDTLFMVFPQRIRFFGEETLVRGLWAYHLSKYKPDASKEIVMHYAYYFGQELKSPDQRYMRDYLYHCIIQQQKGELDSEHVCAVYRNLKKMAVSGAARNETDTSWTETAAYLDNLMKTFTSCT
jgi:hypothetical protein